VLSKSVKIKVTETHKWHIAGEIIEVNPKDQLPVFRLNPVPKAIEEEKSAKPERAGTTASSTSEQTRAATGSVSIGRKGLDNLADYLVAIAVILMLVGVIVRAFSS
jgi:hypothetical protein